MDHSHTMLLLWPVLNFSYGEIISDTKINILKSIDRVGGLVSGLEELEQISGYGKPLLSLSCSRRKGKQRISRLGSGRSR